MAKKTGLAAISYILGIITGIIVLLVSEREDKFTRFHAIQSIFLCIALFVISIILGLITFLLGAPFWGMGMMNYSSSIAMSAGLLLAGVIWTLYGIGVFVLWLYMIISAYSGKKTMLPVIGHWSENAAK